MSSAIDPLAASITAAAPARILGRKPFVDNLRWSMIVLVISMHAAVTYSHFGSWYYYDAALTDRPSVIALATYQSFLQAFFMGLLFGVAGYFARGALARKGARRFIAERAFRLGLPTLLYMLVIGAVTQYYITLSWRPAPPSSFAAEWLRRIANGEMLSNTGPLWFCVALLAFSIVYAATGAPRAGHGTRTGPRLWTILLFIAAMGIATFAIRLAVPEGRAVLNLQLGDFAQYILMFAAGIHAQKTGWPDRLTARGGWLWGLAGLGLGGIAWVLLISLGGGLEGHLAPYGGGLHWQSLAKSLWEAFVGTALSLALIALYRDHFDGETRLSRFLSANGFAVYVLHPPVLILITQLLHLWPEPSLLRVVVATVMATIASFAVAAMVRRAPGLRAIL